MLEDPSTTHFQCTHWGKVVVAQNFPLHGPIHPPLNTVKSSCPLSWETPPKHKVSISMLHSGDGVLGVVLLLQTRRVELMPNSSILVSSDHITFSQASSGSSRCSLANFRWACACAFFSRGTLLVQQDFNPSRCSVLLMVLFMTVVPTAFRSLTRCEGPGWSGDTHKSPAGCRYVGVHPIGREGCFPTPYGGENSDCGLCLYTKSQFRVFNLLGDPEWSPIWGSLQEVEVFLLGDFNVHVSNNIELQLMIIFVVNKSVDYFFW